MTFDRKIDFYPATIGSVAMASTTESTAIVRKVLVAQALQTVLDQNKEDRCLW